MKFKVITLSLCSVFVLSACTGFSNSDSKTTSSAPTAQGTGDSGGGNIYQGKPLEAYIIDPTTLPAYKQSILPLLTKLQADNGSLSVIHIMNWSAGKTWYVLPGPLTALPADKIGSAVPAEQGALQDFESVWIDSDLFAKMTIDAQGELLMHEFLMGIKLLRFETYKNQCIAAKDVDCDFSDNGNKFGTPADLTANDYNQIRTAVAQLKSLPATASLDDISNIFATNDFSFPYFAFWSSSAWNFASSQDIQDIFNGSLLTKTMPTHFSSFGELDREYPGVYDETATGNLNWKFSGDCQIDNVSVTATALQLTMTGSLNGASVGPIAVNAPIVIDPSAISYPLPATNLGVPVAPSTNFAGYQEIYLQQVLSSAKPDQVSVGDKIRNIILVVNGRNLQAVKIFDTAVVRFANNGQIQQAVNQTIGGDEGYYFCAMQSSYILKPGSY